MKPVFWKRKTIALGEQTVSELTILEWKPLFSLKLFHFHETDGCQDRFHTHAFNAFSFLLKGDYTEEVICNGVIMRRRRSHKRLLFIPKNQYHRITRSKGCWTLLLTGPWGSEFKELRHEQGNMYREVTCGEHRVDKHVGKLRRII